MRYLVAALGLLALSGTAAGAQAIQVTGVQGVTFGNLLPGTAVSIARTDGANAARFDIRGGNGRQVQIRFTLPASMSGPSGATMPLSYAAADAGYSSQQSVGNQIVFDPRAAYLANLSATGRGSVFLGAKATPSSSQRAGSYTATLTLTVIYFP